MASATLAIPPTIHRDFDVCMVNLLNFA